MNYLFQLALPAGMYIILASLSASGSSIEIFKELPGHYILLAIPHWTWAGIAYYLKFQKPSTTGGFIGINLAIICIGSIAYKSMSPEAGNIWFLYYPAASLGIAFGSCIGYYIERKRGGAA